MKPTLVIAYSPGAYGTYLEWLLNAMVTDNTLESPFTPIGNSHKSKFGKQLLNINGWEKYINDIDNALTVRLHPKTFQHESVSKNLEKILKNCSQSILVYPSKDTQILCMNNYMTKVYDDKNLFNGILKEVDLNEIYNNFPLDSNDPVEKIPTWIVREYLSFYLVPAWRSQIDWFLPDVWSNDRCLILYVDELLFNIGNTLEKIKKFWQVDFVRPIEDMLPFHQQMLSLQTNLDQDKICKKIVDSVIDNRGEFIEWNNLPLTSESWIQWQLREIGYEIKCHDLDQFPNNSEKLKSLIYRI